MKKLMQALTVALLAVSALGAKAQNTYTSYFLEDFTYRYQVNPAFGSSQCFVSFPALGNLNIGLSGNIGLSSLLYNYNGRTTTLLNPNISADKALAKIHTNNLLSVNVGETILATGFRAFNGYNTITLGTKVRANVNLPGELFSLLKNGIENHNYDIGNLRAHGIGYVELALGHSHKINDRLRIGATLKVLVGAGSVDASFKNTSLDLSGDSWIINTEGTMRVNAKGASYKTDINDQGREYINGFDFDNPGVGGYGAAFDLGAVYKVPGSQDITVSASILDLGFISWSSAIKGSTKGQFSTDKYTFNVDKDATNSFKNEWEQIKNSFTELYQLTPEKGDKGNAEMLGATINVGAEYKLPNYKKLSFGLLNTTRVQSVLSWTDFRLTANFAPCNWFDMTVSGHAGTFGPGFGWLLNLHPSGFNFYIGMDHLVGKLAKQGIPLNSNVAFNMGINFTFGRKVEKSAPSKPQPGRQPVQ